jgi:uncharacterized protein YecE (DUF72 family)
MSSVPNILVGCNGLTLDRGSYWKHFGVMEIEERVVATVKPRTLAQWREGDSVKSFVLGFGLDATRSGFGSEEAARAWEKTIRVYDTLGAETILLRTPPQFRPTAANRRALIDFFKERREGRRVAWWAEGLWESQEEARDHVSAEAGLIPVVDPLGLEDDDDLPDGADVYWRLMGRRGLRGGFSDYEIECLLELTEERQSATIIFTANTMRAEAVRFGRLVRRESAIGDTDGA